MSNRDIHVVELPPMRVICINGFGSEPENQAYDKIFIFAQGHGLLEMPHRLFGYNNPNPTPGSPNYGYDVWMTVDETVQADGDAKLIDFPGGLYAVMRVDVKDPWADIPSAWQELVRWRENSPYREGRHQWLEEHIGTLNETVNTLPFTLDLYLPIRQ
jgi:DNA gyrase inhibitor GyrI